MANKRDNSKPGAKPEPAELIRKPMIVQVRGSQEYKDWADDLARFDSRSLASLVDRALRQYAREIGFRDGPAER